MDFRKLKRNGIIIAEALARYMYNLSDKVTECMKTQHTVNIIKAESIFSLRQHCFKIAMLMCHNCVRVCFFFPQGFTKGCASFQGPAGKFPVILIGMYREVLTSGVSLET